MTRDRPQTSRTHRPGRRLGLLVFLWFLLFYLFTTSGHIFTPDGVLMYLVTEGLVERGDPAMPYIEHEWPFWHTEIGKDGRRYAIYGLGPSLAAIPQYLLGKGLLAVVPDQTETIFQHPLHLFHPRTLPCFVKMYGVSLTNALVAAGTVWLLFATALTLGFRKGTALALAFILGVASPLWHYSKTFFSEPMGGFALLLFLFLMMRYRQSRSATAVFGAGVAVSLAVFVKTANAVFLAAALPFGILTIWSESGERLKHTAWFSIGLVSTAPLVFWYNAHRFGSVWETGYSAKIDFSHPFLQGFAGLLCSPGRGLFLYFPLAVLALVVLFGKWRRHRTTAGLFLAMFAIPLLFHAKWWSWEGGWCWGPRFFVPVLPFLVLPLGHWIEDAGRSSARMWTLWGLVIASAGIALSGVLVNFNDYYALMKAHYGITQTPYYPDMRWSWQWSPLLKYWGFEHKNFFLLTAAFSTPGAAFWRIGFAVLAASLVGTTALLWRQWHREQDDSPRSHEERSTKR